jgi:peptidoglycan biosynthesis protein MviN/MurJ (putative lipid II flippase)
MASHAAADRWMELRATVATSLRLLALAVLPVIGFLVVLRGPLVFLWFQRGAFSAEAAGLVSSLIPPLGVMFAMRSFGTITVYALMALRRLRPLLLVLSMEVLANVGLNLLLAGPLGLRGVVLATAMAMVVSGVFVGKILLDALHGWSFRSLLWDLRKPFGASLGSILFLAFACRVLGVGGDGSSRLASVVDLGGLGLAFLFVHVLLCSRLGLIELRFVRWLPRIRLTEEEWSGSGTETGCSSECSLPTERVRR